MIVEYYTYNGSPEGRVGKLKVMYEGNGVRDRERNVKAITRQRKTHV